MNPIEIRHLLASPLNKFARSYDEEARFWKFIQEGGKASDRERVLTAIQASELKRKKALITAYQAQPIRPPSPHVVPAMPHVSVPPDINVVAHPVPTGALGKIHPAAWGLGGAALLGGGLYTAHKLMKKESQ